MNEFDDSLLEAPELVDDEGLRALASIGARIRRAAQQSPLGGLERNERPRGVLIVGPEARLVRAVLEPVCPVPLMAWPGPGLPAWLGPLDLMVIIDDGEPYSWMHDAGAEAARRGAKLLVAAREGSELIGSTARGDTTLLAMEQLDPTSGAVAMLSLLGQLGVGPTVALEQVADAADLVAESCSPHRDLATNPGKELALQLADRIPLIWGGTVLANRAARRLGEAVRRVSGTPALAADAGELSTVLRGVERRDLFADPGESDGMDPVLVLLDTDKVDNSQVRLLEELEQMAEGVGVRIARISSGDEEIRTGSVERYVTLLTHGLYGAEYLRIGMGR